MKTLVRTCACVAALTALALQAEEENADAAAAEASVADPAAAKKASESAEKYYRTLPLCRQLVGAADVLLPGETEWKSLIEGKFYPLGSSYRTTDAASKLTIEFGKECQVKVEGIASFSTRIQGLSEKTRSIALISGTLTLSLPRNLPEKAFSVAAPGFTVTSAAGESTYRYENTGDGDEAIVRCVTGTLALKGLHFEIPAMHAADEIRIVTEHDHLFTSLFGTSGDYELRLDQGMVRVRDVEKGTHHVEPKTLIWKLSPRTAARIHRARPAIGERLSVTTMTFDASGKVVNRCAFSEGRYELNTGEQGEIALKRIEEQSKKAAEAAEAQGDSTSLEKEEEPTEEAPNEDSSDGE